MPLVPAGPPQQQLQLQGQGQGLEDGVSEAGTDWSDGIAVAYRAHQSRLGTGFAALMQTREVWAICIAQYTGVCARWHWGTGGLGRGVGRGGVGQLHRAIRRCVCQGA